jgi:hypothetical protein
MQNVNVKKSTHKMVAHKPRAPRITLDHGIPEFMVRIARERHMKISESPTAPKYRHD